MVPRFSLVLSRASPFSCTSSPGHRQIHRPLMEDRPTSDAAEGTAPGSMPLTEASVRDLIREEVAAAIAAAPRWPPTD